MRLAHTPVLAAGLLAGLVSWAPARTPQRPAGVAVLLDLHGAQASLGRPAMNGFLLGLQEAGLESPVPYAALLDTRTDPAATLESAQVAARTATVAAGFTDNDSVLLAGPSFEDARVPFLSIGATSPTLPSEVGEHVFLTPFGDNTQAAAGAEFALAAFGTSVAILWDSTQQYTRTLPRYFRTRFEELGGQVLLDEPYDGGCDLSALGAQVAALSPTPSFVYLAGLPECIGDVVGSLRLAGVLQPVLGGDGLDTPELLDGPAGPTSDVWFTTHAWLSPSTGSPEVQSFLAAYEDAYGAAPADAFAALGYDAARLLVDALRRAGRSRSKDVFAALEATTGFEGVTGTISYSPGNHVPLKTVWILSVLDGQTSLADAFVPSSVPPPLPN